MRRLNSPIDPRFRRGGSHRIERPPRISLAHGAFAGAGLGAAVPPDDYWPAVTEVCRRHGVLVIADEVMTGFGRTGQAWVVLSVCRLTAAAVLTVWGRDARA